eukprot:TRINITY_DN4864_c1_g1_i4.p1 TRINITY_DN4864_c1_g1~~TRINITY_DN4864_c1_g1_i4.p1  ORF type:complete len:571 (-),score=263.14 TRINITY_DN4864_c1_g1_i4:9-1721(-)
MYGSELDAKARADAPRLLLARLSNEVTRTPAVLALSRCCGSAVAVEGDVQAEFASVLGGFLRKTDRAVRVAALEALTCLASSGGGGGGSAGNPATARLPDVAGLVSDGDPRVAALSLRFAATVVKVRGAAAVGAVVSSGVFPAAMELLQSPLLQGTALEALLDFVSALAVADAPSLKADALLAAIRAAVFPASAGGGGGGGRTAAAARGGGGASSTRLQIHTAARCVAAVVRSSDNPPARVETTSAFVRDINGGSGRGEAVVFALAVIAEVGRCALIPRESETAAWGAVLDVLGGDGEEELKTAAATALGAMAGGGLSTGDGGSAGVERLVALIRERPSSQRYLLLLAVKEAIASSPRQRLAIAIPLLYPLLIETVEASGGGGGAAAEEAADAGGGGDGGDDSMAVERTAGRASETGVRDAKSSGEESIRTATAECLGMLAAAQPSAVIPWLVDSVKGPSSTVRAVAVTAVKYALSGSLPAADGDGGDDGAAAAAATPGDDLDAALTPVLGDFLRLVGDRSQGVAVRKGALQTLGALARWRPELLREYLSPAAPGGDGDGDSAALLGRLV